jgi:hypothetical protein
VLPSSDRDDVDAVESRREEPPVSFASDGTPATLRPATDPYAASAAVKLADPAKLRELRAGARAFTLEAAAVGKGEPVTAVTLGAATSETGLDNGDAFSI